MIIKITAATSSAILCTFGALGWLANASGSGVLLLAGVGLSALAIFV